MWWGKGTGVGEESGGGVPIVCPFLPGIHLAAPLGNIAVGRPQPRMRHCEPEALIQHLERQAVQTYRLGVLPSHILCVCPLQCVLQARHPQSLAQYPPMLLHAQLTADPDAALSSAPICTLTWMTSRVRLAPRGASQRRRDFSLPFYLFLYKTPHMHQAPLYK